MQSLHEQHSNIGRTIFKPLPWHYLLITILYSEATQTFLKPLWRAQWVLQVHHNLNYAMLSNLRHDTKQSLPQGVPSFCPPSATPCWQSLAQDTHGCRVSCTGLYADIDLVEDAPVEYTYKDNVQDKLTLLALNCKFIWPFLNWPIYK